MNISRRTFAKTLAGGAVLAVPLAGGLAGCTTAQVQQVVTDALNIAQSILNSASSVTALLSGGAANTWNNLLATLKADLATLQAAAATPANSTVTAIVNGINDVLGFLAAAGIAIPSPVSAIISAAATLLPLIETAFNIVVTAAAKAPRAKFAAAVPMSVTKARYIVAAYAQPS